MVLGIFWRQSRALHTELELEYSSWDSSRNKFSRVETRRVECHFFVIFGNFGKRLVPTRSDPNLCEFFEKIRVGMSFRESGRVRKARTLLKYFRNLKKVNFRNSQKQKFRKKRLTQGLKTKRHLTG